MTTSFLGTYRMLPLAVCLSAVMSTTASGQMGLAGWTIEYPAQGTVFELFSPFTQVELHIGGNGCELEPGPDDTPAPPITLTVYDYDGNILADTIQVSPAQQGTWDYAITVGEGIYYAELSSGETPFAETWFQVTIVKMPE